MALRFESVVSVAAAVTALSMQPRQRWAAAGVLALVILVTAMGAWRVAGGTLVSQGPVLKVGLLQGNVEQGQKWNPAYGQEILDRYMRLSQQVINVGARLVVWPEASTPFFFRWSIIRS